MKNKPELRPVCQNTAEKPLSQRPPRPFVSRLVFLHSLGYRTWETLPERECEGRLSGDREISQIYSIFVSSRYRSWGETGILSLCLHGFFYKNVKKRKLEFLLHTRNFYEIRIPAGDLCFSGFFFAIRYTEIPGIMFFCAAATSDLISFRWPGTNEMLTKIGKIHHTRSHPITRAGT